MIGGIDLPGTGPAFEAAYFSVHTGERHWQQRTWLVNTDTAEVDDGGEPPILN